jgi:hypothetical protein
MPYAISDMRPAISNRDVIAGAALTGGVFFLYRQAFRVYFLNEDFTHLWHCRFGPGKGVWTLLTQDVMSGSYSWKPFLQLWFALNYAAWGLNPFGYRLVTVLWHAGAVCLVYGIGAQCADRGRGFIAAALFAAHPLHVESVSWTCAAAGVMASAWVLLAVLAYLRWRAGSGSALCVMMPFAAALLTHESAVVLPALLLSADLVLPGPPAGGRRVVLYGGVAGVLVGFLAVRRLVSPAALSFMVGLDPRWPVTARELVLLLAAKLRLTAALVLTLGPSTGNLALPVAAALGAIAVGLWWRGRPVALWAVCWIGIAAAPFMLLLLGPFPRYLYLLLAGCGWLVAELIAAAVRGAGRWHRAAVICAAAALVLWMVHMVRRIDAQEAAFVERGNLTRTLLVDLMRVLPQPRPGGTLVFYRLGDLRTRDGVFVYGLEEAARLLYGDEALHVEFRALNDVPDPLAYRLWYHDGRLDRLDAGRN